LIFDEFKCKKSLKTLVQPYQIEPKEPLSEKIIAEDQDVQDQREKKMDEHFGPNTQPKLEKIEFLVLIYLFSSFFCLAFLSFSCLVLSLLFHLLFHLTLSLVQLTHSTHKKTQQVSRDFHCEEKQIQFSGKFEMKVTFEGPNVLEGVKKLIPLNIAEPPLPPHLAEIHSSPANSYTLS